VNWHGKGSTLALPGWRTGTARDQPLPYPVGELARQGINPCPTRLANWHGKGSTLALPGWRDSLPDTFFGSREKEKEKRSQRALAEGMDEHGLRGTVAPSAPEAVAWWSGSQDGIAWWSGLGCRSYHPVPTNPGRAARTGSLKKCVRERGLARGGKADTAGDKQPPLRRPLRRDEILASKARD
jgi:hypothetical protein